MKVLRIKAQKMSETHPYAYIIMILRSDVFVNRNPAI